MDQQILQAVDIALSGNADPQLKQQAYSFIEQIKTTPQGYALCLDILVEQGSALNDQFRFFIYQVIDENVHRLLATELGHLSDTLLAHVKDASVSLPPAFVKNRLAAVAASVFCRVYIEVRPQFLRDLMAAAAASPVVADEYIRIVLAIHSEIGDKFILRLREAQERNVLLKDQIRVTDMAALVGSWKKILTAPADNNDDLLSNTLKAVGAYIEWMDITLFVADSSFTNCVFSYLGRSPQRIETCATLIEIISKKMAPSNKLELLSLLNLTLVIASLGSDADVEFLEAVAKLLGQIGLELLVVLEGSPALEPEIGTQLMGVWPFVFSFMSHEYDDVLLQVFPFVSQYLLVCKKFASLASVELLSTLLNKAILKMKFDSDADGLDEGEDDDLEFAEMRLRLKNIQDTIAVLKPALYVEAIPLVINELLQLDTGKPTDASDWRTIELGLYELNNFADLLRNNLINVPKPQINSLEPFLLFQSFLVKLIQLNWIINIDHPKVQLGFFELVVRHYHLLSLNQELTIRILEIFTSPLGLFNRSERVRLRSWYLFFRFTKLTKPALNNATQFIESTLLKLLPLLEVKAVLPIKDEDNDIIEDGNFTSQLYLFETIGLLISLTPTADNTDKLKMIDMVFQPLFADLERCVSEVSLSSGRPASLVTLQAHHLLMAIGTFARGYDYDYNNKYSPEIIAKVSNAATVVLYTLENFVKSEKVRDASRFAFARFIPILGKEVNNHLSKLVSLILLSNDLKYSELADFLAFLGQIVHNFKTDDNIFQLLNSLLTPLFDKVFTMLKYNGDNNEYQDIPDILRDKNALKKAFMNLLSTIVLNHNSSLLVTETNKPKFPLVLENLFEYAYDLDDPTVSKLAVIQVVNFISIMGTGRINDPQDTYGLTLPVIEGIEDYLMNKSISLAFELPFQKQQFDIKDAQFRIIAQEIAALLKTYQKTKGDAFLSVLSSYLTNMGLAQDLMNDFGNNLVKLDQRDFKKYFIGFIQQLKG